MRLEIDAGTRRTWKALDRGAGNLCQGNLKTCSWAWVRSPFHATKPGPGSPVVLLSTMLVSAGYPFSRMLEQGADMEEGTTLVFAAIGLRGGRERTARAT